MTDQGNSGKKKMPGVLWIGGGILLILILLIVFVFLPQKRQADALALAETSAAFETQSVITGIANRTSTAAAWTKTPTPSATFTPTNTNTPTITPTITPTLGIGSTRVRESDGMVQVYVPEGEFTMGDDYAWPHVKPQHVVYLDGFWIDQTEMTNARYLRCVNDGACDPPFLSDSFTKKDYFGNPKYDDFPVVYMSWENAKQYCLWVGADLPTEAQWEKAARSDDKRTYPWGNQVFERKYANADDMRGDTKKVGSYPLGASPYGALDMAGNVYEWVNDFFAYRYYAESPYRNPQGPTEFSEYEIDVHILRGGAWDTGIGGIVTYQHSAVWPDHFLATNYYGFRCANNE